MNTMDVFEKPDNAIILAHWDNETKQEVKRLSNIEKSRFNAIIAMNIMICSMNDESAYMTWINLVPDCAGPDDFLDFARDDPGTKSNQLFDDAVILFKELWAKYAAKERGLFIGEQLY